MEKIGAFYGNVVITMQVLKGIDTNGVKTWENKYRIEALFEESYSLTNDEINKLKSLEVSKLTIQKDIGTLDPELVRFIIGEKPYQVLEYNASPAIGNIRVYEMIIKKVIEGGN